MYQVHPKSKTGKANESKKALGSTQDNHSGRNGNAYIRYSALDVFLE